MDSVITICLPKFLWGHKNVDWDVKNQTKQNSPPPPSTDPYSVFYSNLSAKHLVETFELNFISMVYDKYTKQQRIQLKYNY